MRFVVGDDGVERGTRGGEFQRRGMLAGELEAGLLLQVDGAGLALEAYGLVTSQEASLSIPTVSLTS